MTQKNKLTVDEVLKKEVVKLDLGGGDHPAAGYINVDIEEHPLVELVLDVRELDKHFPGGSVHGMMCRDTLQCFPHSEVKSILHKWYRVLRPRSRIVIQCYDIDQVIKKYNDKEIDRDRLRALLYGSQRTENKVFKNCFDEKYLRGLLESVGFHVQDIVYPEMRIKVVAVRGK